MLIVAVFAPGVEGWKVTTKVVVPPLPATEEAGAVVTAKLEVCPVIPAIFNDALPGLLIVKVLVEVVVAEPRSTFVKVALPPSATPVTLISGPVPTPERVADDELTLSWADRFP